MGDIVVKGMVDDNVARMIGGIVLYYFGDKKYVK